MYINQCEPCKAAGTNTIYLGESCRSLQERLGDHYRDIGRDLVESHMRIHSEGVHQGEINFKAMIHSTFRRQVSEAVHIKLESKKGAALLNSKTEFNRCILPELEVKLGQDKQREDPEDQPQPRSRNMKTSRANYVGDAKNRPSKMLKMDSTDRQHSSINVIINNPVLIFLFVRSLIQRLRWMEWMKRWMKVKRPMVKVERIMV